MATYHDGINPHAASDLLRQAMNQKYVDASIYLAVYAVLVVWLFTLKPILYTSST